MELDRLYTSLYSFGPPEPKKIDKYKEGRTEILSRLKLSSSNSTLNYLEGFSNEELDEYVLSTDYYQGFIKKRQILQPILTWLNGGKFREYGMIERYYQSCIEERISLYKKKQTQSKQNLELKIE